MNKFKIGDRVRNSKCGTGTIIDIDIYDENVPYMVEYDNEITDGCKYRESSTDNCHWQAEHTIEKAEDEERMCLVTVKGYKKVLDENKNLKAEVETLKSHKNEYKNSYSRYLKVSESLRDKLEKQKTINKELIDENEKLKLELKPYNVGRVEIGDVVETATRAWDCYPDYIVWLKENAPNLVHNFCCGRKPFNGLKGIVVAKDEDHSPNDTICAVLIDKQVYLIKEQGLRLRNS